MYKNVIEYIYSRSLVFNINEIIHLKLNESEILNENLRKISQMKLAPSYLRNEEKNYL